VAGLCEIDGASGMASRPDRFDLVGTIPCLTGVALMMYASR
jgi:drug/metabolite transporter superfamily protein YnfA